MSDEMHLHALTGVLDVPYVVPFPYGPGTARKYHRQFFWSLVDRDTYECPDCDRGKGDVIRFEVHHIDGNPLNGWPENLVALCWRCHRWRHSENKTLSGLTVEEWKEAFLQIGKTEAET